MIKVEDLVKTYFQKEGKVEALKGVNISVNEGVIFGVIGLSGAGKSSLVRCISSLENPTSGKIIIDDKDISKLSKNDLRNAQKKIGLVFQHFNLLKNSTVYENIAFPLTLSKNSKEYIKKRVGELLEMVDLKDKANAYPDMLSGGQKQRVGIARALANEPKILLCDEATSALDPQTTKSILKLLKEINKKLNITILVITHEMEVIKEICNYVAILEDGKIIEEGSVVDVFVTQKTRTAKSFFGDKDLELGNHIYKKVFDKGNTILKVVFIGETSINPFISTVIKNFDVDIAILAGNIQDISGTIIGTLVIEIRGTEKSVKDSIQYLVSEKLVVEVMSNENQP